MGTTETKKTPNISAGAITRTIILVLALVNQVLAVMGRSLLPIEDETVIQLVSTIATVIAALVAWWKNNSFSKEAIASDEYMNQLRHKGE